MFDVLIIEDDPFKETALRELIEQIDPRFTFDIAVSVQTAVASIRSKEYGLVLLDMALPSHDRSRGKGSPTSMPSGGLEILLTLNRLRRVDPVVVVTQYAEVEINGSLIQLNEVSQELSRIIKVQLLEVVHYDQADDVWRAAIENVIKVRYDKNFDS